MGPRAGYEGRRPDNPKTLYWLSSYHFYENKYLAREPITRCSTILLFWKLSQNLSGNICSVFIFLVKLQACSKEELINFIERLVKAEKMVQKSVAVSFRATIRRHNLKRLNFKGKVSNVYYRLRISFGRDNV